MTWYAAIGYWCLEDEFYFYFFLGNAHISNQYIKNVSQTSTILAYHGILLQISRESNRIPEILQAGMIRFNRT
jgi:hypothetical protein